MAKRTYMTFAQSLKFAQWTHSDERRFEKEKEVRAKINAGMTLPTPAIIAVLTVTKEDLKRWLESQEVDASSDE